MSGLSYNPLFSVLSFLGFLLSAVSLPCHLQSWNSGTCMYMIWTSFGCLILFINSIIWNANVTNWAPVWCDISSRFLIGASVGIPASALCIIRRLYHVTKLQKISVENSERRREMIVDISIGIGLPCVVMALECIVHGRRFMIFERFGCYPRTVNTLASYFLVFMWPLVIGFISQIYAVLTFRRALLQTTRLKRMSQVGLAISSGRYWRLMALCIAEIIFTVPLSLYTVVINLLMVNGEPHPYVSWASIHSDFYQILQYPASVWKSTPSFASFGVELTRWTFVLCAFVIFAFFGWAQEVQDFYSQAFWSACRCLGYSRPSTPGPVSLPFDPPVLLELSSPGLLEDERSHGNPPTPPNDLRRYIDTTSPSMPFTQPESTGGSTRLSSEAAERDVV